MSSFGSSYFDSSTASSSGTSSGTPTGGGNYSLIPSTSSGCAASGTISVGNNRADGAPEFYLGGSAVGDAQAGQVGWDGNPDGGFNVASEFEFTADFSGSQGVSLGIGMGDDRGISGSMSPSGNVGRVQVSAEAASGGEFNWGELTVRFFRGGVQTEEIIIDPESTPGANMIDGSSGSQAVEVTPRGMDNDGVHVLGTFQMKSASVTAPADMKGQILAFPN